MRLLGTLAVAACAALFLAPPAAADRPGPDLRIRQSVIDPAVSSRGLDALHRRTA